MVMTKKDYQLIADCINKTAEAYYKTEGIKTESKSDYVNGIIDFRNRLAFELGMYNPRFSEGIFYEATMKTSEIQNELYNAKWED